MAVIDQAMGDEITVTDGSGWGVNRVGAPSKIYASATEAFDAASQMRDASQVVYAGQPSAPLTTGASSRAARRMPALSTAQAAELLGVTEQGLIGAVQSGELYRKDRGPWSRAEIDSLARSAWLRARRHHLGEHTMSIIASLKATADPVWVTRAARRRTRLCDRQVHRYVEVARRSGGVRHVAVVEQACSCGAAREVAHRSLLGIDRVVAIRRVADGAFDSPEPQAGAIR